MLVDNLWRIELMLDVVNL